MSGACIKPGAVDWLLHHPSVWSWSDLAIARALIHAGLYSRRTRLRDIRVSSLKRQVLDRLGLCDATGQPLYPIKAVHA